MQFAIHSFNVWRTFGQLKSKFHCYMFHLNVWFQLDRWERNGQVCQLTCISSDFRYYQQIRFNAVAMYVYAIFGTAYPFLYRSQHEWWQIVCVCVAKCVVMMRYLFLSKYFNCNTGITSNLLFLFVVVLFCFLTSVFRFSLNSKLNIQSSFNSQTLCLMDLRPKINYAISMCNVYMCLIYI